MYPVQWSRAYVPLAQVSTLTAGCARRLPFTVMGAHAASTTPAFVQSLLVCLQTLSSQRNHLRGISPPCIASPTLPPGAAVGPRQHRCQPPASGNSTWAERRRGKKRGRSLLGVVSSGLSPYSRSSISRSSASSSVVAPSASIPPSASLAAGSRDDGNEDFPPKTSHRASRMPDPHSRGRPRKHAGAVSPTVQTQKDYLHLIKAAGVRGNWREVAALVREMGGKGVEGNIYIYNTAIAAFARCGRPQEAESLLTTMLSRGVAPDTISYNSAINGYARGGDLAAAVRLMERMNELSSMGGVVRPDQFTYNSVVNAAAKRGDAVAAAKILKVMTQAGVNPTLITYNSCLAACKSKGDLRRAVVLLELMREEGIHPDQRSYSAAIATAGRRGQWEEVQGFLETMRREGLAPDKVTFNTAIAAVASSGQCRMAFSLLKDMKQEGLKPDQISFNGILSACGHAGEWRAALRVLDVMREAGVPPNVYNYSSAMDACGKAGRQREALALLAHMRRSGVRADTVVYNAAIDACSVAVDWKAALVLLEEMKNGVAAAADMEERGATSVWTPPPPDVVSYSSAITACARAKRVDEALDLLAELRLNEAQAAAAAVRRGLSKGQGHRVGFPVPNLVAYSAGLFACLKAGDVQRGAELLDEMIAVGVQPNKIHCDTMVAAWSAQGEPKRAVALMKRLQAQGFEPSPYTYETIVWGFAQVADWEAAVRFLAYVLSLGLQPSVRSWDAAIAACSQAGLWERALALLADMRKQGIRPSRVTYTAAVVGINRRRHSSWAPKLANLARLLQSGPDTVAGESAEAEIRQADGGGLLDGGDDKATDGTGPSPEELDFSIEALGDADDAGGAARLLRVMRREGFHASPRAYRSVIYACARVGLLDEAMALAKEMQGSSRSAIAKEKQEQHRQPTLSLSSGTGDDDVGPKSEDDTAERTPRGRRCVSLGVDVSRGSAAGPEANKADGVDESCSKRAAPPQRVTLERGATGNGAAGVGSSHSTNTSSRGFVSEDEDAAEFDLAVVYNCIICNFARAASGGGGSIGVNACDHRTKSMSVGTAALATDENTAAVTSTVKSSAEAIGGDWGQRRNGENASTGQTSAETGNDRGEGLVALLMGVADRAKGSLTDEAANGGVEIAYDGEESSLLQIKRVQ